MFPKRSRIQVDAMEEVTVMEVVFQNVDPIVCEEPKSGRFRRKLEDMLVSLGLTN